MSVLRTILRRISRAFSGAESAFYRGEDLPAPGGAVLSDALQQSVWVYSCVTVLAETVSGIPFRVSSATAARNRQPGSRRISPTRRDTRLRGDIIETGPVVDLFAQPTPACSAYDFWELVIHWLMLRGRAHIAGTTASGDLVQFSARTQSDAPPIALWVLPVDRLAPVVIGNRTVAYRYHPGVDDPLAPGTITLDQLVTLRLPNPYAQRDGLPPSGVCAIAAATDYAASAFMKGVMLNNADTGLIVSTEQWLTPEQREQVKAALRERKRMAGTADRPAILGGGLKIERPQISAVDLQFLENRKYTRQEICAVFRVPETLLGFTEDANRSVGEEQRANFIEHRIAPLCARLDASMSAIVRCFDPGYVGWHDTESHPSMIAVRRSRVDAMLKLFSVGYPVNEANEWLDLGLPMLPWGDTGYLPFSVTPAGEEPEELPGAPPEETPAGTAAEAWAALRAAVVAEPEHVCGAPEKYLASIRGSVRKKREVLKRFFFEQRRRVLLALEEKYRAAAPITGRATLPTTMRAGLEDLIDMDTEDAKLLARLKPALLGDLEFGGDQLFLEIASPTTFHVKPEEAMKFLRERENKITQINQTTFDELKASLGEGLDAGDTYQQLVDRVKEVYAGADQVRAETIALTETNTAVNQGRFYGMQEAGVDKKAWLASNLENSRPTHQQAGRDYSIGIPVDEPFIVGGEKLMFPGDPKGSPGNVINCKCTSIAVLGDKALAPESYLSYESHLSRRSGLAKMPQDAPADTGGLQHTTHPRPVVLHWTSGVLQTGSVNGATPVPAPTAAS